MKPLEEMGNQWFVNRQVELTYFWDWANSVPLGGRHSIAFAGLRRTGKTAIIHRVFNRLFTEQKRVMPVFISFEDYLYRTELMTTYDFANDYFCGYLRSYLAFKYKRPELHQDSDLFNFELLHQLAQETQDELALELIKSYNMALHSKFSRTPSVNLARWVINFPKGKAYSGNMPTVIFIDEFQMLAEVVDPDDGRIHPICNYFQKASETMWAPILVSGSSVSLLMGRATGGALSGRLFHRTLEPLMASHAIKMIERLGQHLKIKLTDEFVYSMWKITQGYPYAIESLMKSASPATNLYPDLDALDEVVSFEVTNPRGLLFLHYNEEFAKYSTLLNDGQTTKKVMFWATKYPDKRIDVPHVAQQIGVEPKEVQEALQKLERLDIVERRTWSVYHGPTEPMLKRYIAYQHDYEIRGLTLEESALNVQKEANQARGEESHAVGKLAEALVEAVMGYFQGQTLDGETYFSYPEPVTVPKFSKIDRRWGVIEDGSPKELDIIGEYPFNEGDDEKKMAAWFVQVKFRKQAVSEKQVTEFLEQIDAVQGVKEYAELTHWYFSKSGFTRGAETLLRESGIYFSDLVQFNALAQTFNFGGFP